MKKTLLFLSIAIVAIACQKDVQELSTNGAQQEFAASVPPGYTVCGTAHETPLMAGQTINVGSVTVWNDETNVYVSYQTTGSYLLKKTHLFVGACSAIPVNNSGNPRIGQYPYKTDHGTGVSIYTYTIPRSTLPEGCLCVSAHAEIIAYGANGTVTFSQTAWGQGTQLNDGGSWAMKFDYCQQDCDGGPR
jgi:hypothetical protein